MLEPKDTTITTIVDKIAKVAFKNLVYKDFSGDSEQHPNISFSTEKDLKHYLYYLIKDNELPENTVFNLIKIEHYPPGGAEGKEYSGLHLYEIGERFSKGTILMTFKIDDYLNKNNFKVDNWVRDIHSNELHKVIELFDDVVRVRNIRLNASYSTEYTDIELWKPKNGEYCWFWNDKTDLCFDQFKSEPNLIDTVFYTQSEKVFKYCEPFIGEYPTPARN